MAGASLLPRGLQVDSPSVVRQEPSCHVLTWLGLRAKDLHLAGTHAHQLHRQPHIPGVLDVLPEQLLLAVERHPPCVLPLHAKTANI
jgi:hypothetical protein